jgi:hypothetical protein
MDHIELRIARLAQVRLLTLITDDGRAPESITATDICGIADNVRNEVIVDDARWTA